MSESQEEQKTAPRWGGKVLVLGVIILAISLLVSYSLFDESGGGGGVVSGFANLVGIVLIIAGVGGLIFKK